MTESIKSVHIVVRLDFKGHDLSKDALEEAINDMEYRFFYNDDYTRIVGTEIVDTFVNIKSDPRSGGTI